MLRDLWSDLHYRWQALVHRERIERDLDDELRAHLEHETARYVRAGESGENAWRRARLALGGVDGVKEASRDARGTAGVEHLWQDLRYGARMLRKTPALTLVVVLSLGLGIGANTAIFSVVDALMLRPLPVHNPDRLVTFETVLADGYRRYNVSFQDYERFAALTSVFSGSAAVAWSESYNVGIGGPTGLVDHGMARVSIVTGNYFGVLGVGAARGRVLAADDDRAQGNHPVAVISDDYWSTRFGRTPDIVGRGLSLNGTAFTIIGVTPRGFHGDWIGWPTDFWVPVAMVERIRPELGAGQARGSRLQYKVLARLADGVTIERARAVATAFHHNLLNDLPSNTGLTADARFELVPAATGYSPQRETFAQPLGILMIVVGLVLLIATANVANLLLARSTTRQREIAVRLALGAARGRIIRQLLTESLLLAALGGMAGLVFSWWGTRVLGAFAQAGPASMIGPAHETMVLRDLGVDARVLVFAAALSLATGLLFGLAPAVSSATPSLMTRLLGRGPGAGSGRNAVGVRRLLVVGQVALSLVLLTGAGLFVRTLRNLETQQLGVSTDRLLLVWALPGQSGHRGISLASYWSLLGDRLAAIPGVEAASATREGLFSGAPSGTPPINVAGGAPAPNGGVRGDGSMTVSPSFFATVGQRLLRGRDFARWDTDSTPRVAIVSESMARRLFGRGTDAAVGRRIAIGAGRTPATYEIVGVVSDARVNSPREPGAAVIYYPYTQQSESRLSRLCLVVRTAGDPARVAASVQRDLRDVDPTLPVVRIDTMRDQLDDLLARDRLISQLSAFFALVAVLLACVGLYGVMSYLAARRTNEIGIRMALGATRASVLGSVLREAMLLVTSGVVIGLPLTFAATRFVATRLYGVSAIDPLTMTAATGLMLGVAAVAGFLPARRAARVDPVVALRYE